MTEHNLQTYPPLNTLKPVADDVWVVDGRLIEFGPWPFRMPFATRMTVIRIGCKLFIHSPTPLAEGLKVEVAAIGEPSWLIGPNRLHYWWIPEWCKAYPGAVVYLAPRITDQAKGRLDCILQNSRSLDDRSC